MQHRQLIVDTETTGLDPLLGHRIIEFAALEMIDRELTGSSLYLRINPQRPIDEQASKVHGIYFEDVCNEPIFGQLAPQIVNYIKGAELIIHNAKFDISFLNYQLQEQQMGVVSNYASGVVDTLTLARQKFPGSKNTLDALCDRFKVSREHRELHGALIDCQLLASVYLALTREQISLLESANSKPKFSNASFKLANGNNNNVAAHLKVQTNAIHQSNDHSIHPNHEHISKQNSDHGGHFTHQHDALSSPQGGCPIDYQNNQAQYQNNYQHATYEPLAQFISKPLVVLRANNEELALHEAYMHKILGVNNVS